MMQFDRISLGRQAKELGFVRDTFEKVCRLADVLSFMESDNLLSESLALKGGTAINLTVFDLPRLSVDINLDYSRNVPREAMLQEREQINSHIQKYMVASGYVLSPKSKQYHALDSFVFEYINAGGMRDNLKIEINYMLRCHVFPTSRRAVRLPWNGSEITVLSVDPMEIFSAKIVALFNPKRKSYQQMIDQGEKGYSQENYKKFCDWWGVYFLQTTSDESAANIYGDYKGRWSIETFNNYIKNDAGFNNLKMQDYYVQHGSDFIMLVTGLIHSRLNESVRKLGKANISTFDILIKAGHMRMVLEGDKWKLHNTRTKDIALLKQMGFTPTEAYPAV